ncbi:MAG: type II/IV secretion system protein [Actinobacteria bacterium]|nr:type II/IV secretion system protein [Actinomycetota bacterium]
MSPERLQTERMPNPTGGEGGTPRGSAESATWSPIAREAIAGVVADVIATTGLLEGEALRRVRERAGEGSFARAILDEGLAPGDAVARSLARRYGLPLVELSSTGVAPAAAKLVPLYVLERVHAIPYELEGNILRVAIADPLNVHGVDELRLATRYQLELGVASREDIEAEVDRLTRSAEAFGARFEDVEVVEEESELNADDGVSDAPLVRLVNSIIFEAAEEGASDIHFEPNEDALVVRSRVDGVLREAQRVPKALANGVTTRLKVLAKLDIAERRQPQDGRMSLNAAAAGRMLDIRVATLPTVEGEAVTMRLIDKSREIPTLKSIGLEPEMQQTLEVVLRKPTGALFVTGPTGSGKSTTLYAALNMIHRPEIKTITVEDPVEYRLAGVNQIQINVKAGLTFASALRTILRSDPDVLMVGEIRDLETARISIEAALTGHFVLSTLHTNDAPSTISRLNEMGVEPFLTGSALSAVLAQRLVRRLCVHCREEYEPSAEELSQVGLPPEVRTKVGAQRLYRKVGCARCGRSGYRGRIAIFQLMVMTEAVERLGAERASSDELERAAMEGGMRRLWDDGLGKALSGLTSLEELARVLA